LQLKEAKLKETVEDKSESISLYQNVHNLYNDIEDLITKNSSNLVWARSKFYGHWFMKFIAWLVAAIISGIISSSFIPWDKFTQWIISIFTC
jgi:hypothetical protein